MIDFDRFWMERNGPYEDEAPDAAVPPGVGEDEILEWEREHGVTLPEPIRTVLKLRNGGSVRDTSIDILPLDQIVPADDDFWEWTEIGDDETPDRGLLFVFGDETETGGTYLMNFNARGPRGAPSVYLDYHGEGTNLVDDTIGGFFEAELASTTEPDVDWSEAEAGLDVLARETIELSSLYDDESASEDQVLAREGGALILFTRERSPEGEILTRTTLPLPLDAGLAEIRPHRPAPIASFALHLQPAESDGIVHAESKATDDGRWKNSTAHGVPIYVTFESTDRDRLRALRAQLLGDEGAARAEAGQDRQAALSEMLDTLTPDQRTAAMLQAALTMREEALRRLAAESGVPGGVPPELIQAAEVMRLKMEEMAERVRQKAAADPADPETLRRIEGLLRGPDAE